MANLRDLRARETAHEQRVAVLCRDDRAPPPIDQAAIRDRSLRTQIENLRKHIDGIEFMLKQARVRVDALEREAAR